jgi:hypothetical protein
MGRRLLQTVQAAAAEAAEITALVQAAAAAVQVVYTAAEPAAGLIMKLMMQKGPRFLSACTPLAKAAQAQSALSGPVTRAYSPAPIQDKCNDYVHSTR